MTGSKFYAAASKESKKGEDYHNVNVRKSLDALKLYLSRTPVERFLR